MMALYRFIQLFLQHVLVPLALSPPNDLDEKRTPFLCTRTHDLPPPACSTLLEMVALGPYPIGSLGAFSLGKGYSAAAIQRKTVKQLSFDLAEAYLQEMERKGLLPKGK